MTYKTGTIHEFMAWTKQVVQDPGAGQDVPKQWLDSSETAIQSMSSEISAEAMVKLLSQENIAVLQAIGQQQPTSLKQLALMTNRKESNLSRTLKKFEQAGIISFSAGEGKAKSPHLIANRVRLEIDLTRAHSAMSIEQRTPQ
ncbi:MAG: MarR family transcriptional regulator [Thermosynechococcaceae cyanobacterium MS004]|nr:MarR family transcriptional regulator [Thermosynechococcaceae cyanobacterium MS004]